MIDWNDLYEKFKNKQLGRDQLEIIKKGVVDDYNSNPDLQRLVQGVGDFYQDLRTVEGEEKYNPLNYLTAGTLRAMEGAGWLADQTAGRFLKDTIHNTLRVDPNVAEIGSQGVQMFAAPKAISKGIGLVNKAIASPQAHNLAYKAGQSARRLKDRLGSVPTTAYDDAIGIFELSSKEFNELSKLSKQPGINSLTLARRFQLQKKALERKYGKGPNSDLQMMAVPPTNPDDITNIEDDKEPLQRKTPTETERELRINRFVNDLAFTVDRVKRDGSIVPTHISKLQPKGSGYDLLGKAKAEWNQWAKRTGFIRELSDRKMTAYVEHLVGKDKYYDVFWKLPNEQRFRKGSRHGPNNVRILLDNRMKTFKDASETILKKLLPKPTKNNLLVFDYDIPRKTNESIVYNTSPKDLMLKRADGTVVGRLGDYHDVLYAPYQELKKGLSENINPTTGRPYITITLPDGTPLPESDIKTQISIWRTNIIRDKIQFIIDEAPTLKGMTQKQKWQYQGSAIQEDMVDFLDKYKDVLKPAKRLRAKLKKEGWDRKYGGILSEDDKVDSEFLTDYEARRRKLANRRTKSLLRSLFGKERIDE